MTKKELTMRRPLLDVYEPGDTIEFTQQRKGRVCNALGDKVAVCPHCRRLGMRKPLLSGKVRFVHRGRKTATVIEPLDACTMWQRTEFRLHFGADSLHPKFRRPGDEDSTVEELR